MAYMSQEKKAKIAPKVKQILAKYKLKGTLAVRTHSTLVLTIQQGSLDFIGNWYAVMTDPARPMPDWQRRDITKRPVPNHLCVNVYHIDSHFTGRVRDALLELKAAMNDGNHDRSDAMTDYFDVGWYIDIHIGNWQKPYTLTK